MHAGEERDALRGMRILSCMQRRKGWVAHTGGDSFPPFAQQQKGATSRVAHKQRHALPLRRELIDRVELQLTRCTAHTYRDGGRISRDKLVANRLRR